MMKHVLLAVLALFLSCPSMAAGRAEVRKTAESSMLLTGNLLVGPDGKVVQYAIDKREEVPKGVLDFVDGNVGRWEFEPTLVEGKPVQVRNNLSLRIIANKQDDGSFVVRLGGVSFLPFKAEEGTEVSSIKMTPPRYPRGAARAAATGTVYLIVKVVRDGSVQDVFAEQVNLYFVANEKIMEQARKIFSDASIQAARQWKFSPPSKGEDMDEPYWIMRVPVDYAMDSSNRHMYGRWKSYVPGPRHSAPWDGLRDLPGFSPDTMVADGELHQTGKGLRLLTPLQGG
jgi:hypothetical protein